MNTNSKRMLALLLSLVLCLSLLPAVNAEEIELIDPEESTPIDIVEPIEITEPEQEAELKEARKLVDSGPCGDDLTWKFFDDGEMVIFGEGDTIRRDEDWQQYSEQVRKLTVKYGVTVISDHAFEHFAVAEVSLPNSLRTIGEGAFYSCNQLTDIIIPSKVTHINGKVFSSCSKLTSVTFNGNLPNIAGNAFANTAVLAVYPDGNTSYNGGNLGGFGGSLTWVDSTEAAAKKPIATTDPADQMTKAHNTVRFSAHGIGLDVSYQWQCRVSPDRGWFNVSLDGAQTPTLSVKAEADREGYQYRCKISNGNGSAYTQPATLSVQPVIDTQPTRIRIPKGETAVFRVEVSGPDLQYQWQLLTPEGTSWINCSYEGNQTNELHVLGKFSRDQFLFRCKITSTHGKLTTKYAELRVTPGVTTQPEDMKANVGETALFSVTATGADTYQWQYYSSSRGRWFDVTGSDYSGADSAELSFPVTLGRDGMQFRCKLTNDGGTTYTRTVTLYVKPSIGTQPASQSVYVSHTASFTVKASGPNLQYQWQYLGATTGKWYSLSDGSEPTDYKGSATMTLTVPAKTSRNDMQYRCKISNAGGTVYTDAVSLTVISVTHPKDAAVFVGDTVTFRVTALGTKTYQWQYYSSSRARWYDLTGSDYSGATAAALSFPVTVGRNGMKYRCKLSTKDDILYSNTVTLHVKPKITAQPTDLSVCYADDAFFTVKASGANLQYQWQYFGASTGKWYNLSDGDPDTSEISGSTGNRLRVPGKLSRDGMQFRCRISNNYGTVYTDTVRLSVSNTMSKAPGINFEAHLGDVIAVNILESFQLYLDLPGASHEGMYLKSYEWQYYDQNSGSWKKPTGDAFDDGNGVLNLPYESKYHGMQFRMKVNSQYGVGYSKPITVKLDPVITTQPSASTINPGEDCTLSVKASGTKLKYQWAKSSRDVMFGDVGQYDEMSGKTSSTLSIKSASVEDAGVCYVCIVTGANGSILTESVSPKIKPAIFEQPKSKTVQCGDSAEFTLRSEGVWGDGYPEYKPCLWQYYDAGTKKWIDIESDSTFFVEIDLDLHRTNLYVHTSELGNISSLSIRCKVFNFDAVTISNTAKLTVKH